MIEAKNISFSYGKTPTLENIRLTLSPGKLYAVIGPNGSGKTTLIKLLASLLKPQGGELLLDGKPYKKFGRKEFARHVALLPQGRNTPDISVYDLVSYGRYPYLDVSRKMTDADRTIVSAALKATDTETFCDRNVRKLSGGERQRVYMAMLYAQDTPYVFLDEPTTHLDISYAFQIAKMMKHMSGENKCVVAVLHDLPLALKYADEVILLNEKQVVSVASPEDIIADQKLKNTMKVDCRFITLDGVREIVVTPIQ